MIAFDEIAKQRFTAKFKKGEDDACWEWTAGKAHNGYGRFVLNGWRHILTLAGGRT